VSVELFGITAADVAGDLPLNTRALASTGEGLTTTRIESWIRQGAGQVCALLERAGTPVATAATTDSPSREVARAAIIAYAVARALEVACVAGDPRVPRAWERWSEARALLQAEPSVVGAAASPDARVASNVPRTERHLTFRDERW
jgi:hypothetical protein